MAFPPGLLRQEAEGEGRLPPLARPMEVPGHGEELAPLLVEPGRLQVPGPLGFGGHEAESGLAHLLEGPVPLKEPFPKEPLPGEGSHQAH